MTQSVDATTAPLIKKGSVRYWTSDGDIVVKVVVMDHVRAGKTDMIPVKIVGWNVRCYLNLDDLKPLDAARLLEARHALTV